MAPKRASTSASPEREEDAAQGPKQASTLPDEVWTGMLDVLNHIYDFRTSDGHDPSKVFHRKVNKRALPGYYDVIKEPVALSTIKAKINNKEYMTIQDFVRDFALIPHNAFVYNLPDAGAYQDGVVVKQQLEDQLKRLVEKNVITEEDAKLPYLGEIPAADDPPVEDEEEDDDEDEDEDDEADEELGDEPPKKRGRGRPRKSSIVKREKEAAASKDDKNDDPETRKKRGRPPKVLTPTEGRIQTVLKGIRKPKNREGVALISHFERLPDKSAMPEYFQEIKNPMAYDVLKRKYKRKKYQSLEQFMKDVDLMCENARQYNEDASQIYKDAVTLQSEAHRLADEVRARPDTEYAGDEGRMPMPEGILHNGELYKVGDWVLIQNVNDLTKPIPTQIYRTYQDAQGGKWVNVCWYYRPEQTVHRFDKHFLENEVVKTGQYRDHRIDEIVGRCFIMFVTRYFKGRPSSISPDTEVFVCDARYNEEKLTFNKIKTWASCLPDEVRDKDYAMEPFPAPRKMKKYPSAIAYLLKDEQKETDELPKPEWGAENAPPKIGAVHRRPRDARDSPPPEPTPPPPPTPPPAPVQRAPDPPQRPSFSPAPQQSASHQSPLRPSSRPTFTQPYTGTPPQPNIQARPFAPSTFPQTPSAFTPQVPRHQPLQPLPATAGAIPGPFQPTPSAASYRGPATVEVYTLPETADAGIPDEIRYLFHTDEAGKVLFFAAPPVWQEGGMKSLGLETKGEGEGEEVLGHSARYLAAKLRRRQEVEDRRRERGREREVKREAREKRERDERGEVETEVMRAKRRAVERVGELLGSEVMGTYQSLFGGEWKRELERRQGELEAVWEEKGRREEEVVRARREREETKKVRFGPVGLGVERA
ncbi:Chromatin structure-remodeling complex subunit rsc1 [Sphaceloma murrayae]|uniref:Chromatin structure-remodeling complex subunit rsc1 n=1 Tax=Sphaceloma murrayae TaxID=2082308 RepID=A0A2K1R3S5_9PEZI|nr:Chromatin structure-remodeling complex subunit rsc1 [Sphaceloma murrayae]